MIEFTPDELDELSQFLFWIEDRKLAGPPWWPGEDGTIGFRGTLSAAVEKIHGAWRQAKGISG